MQEEVRVGRSGGRSETVEVAEVVERRETVEVAEMVEIGEEVGDYIPSDQVEVGEKVKWLKR